MGWEGCSWCQVITGCLVQTRQSDDGVVCKEQIALI
jgi:hypothetical protein